MLQHSLQIIFLYCNVSLSHHFFLFFLWNIIIHIQWIHNALILCCSIAFQFPNRNEYSNKHLKNKIKNITCSHLSPFPQLSFYMVRRRRRRGTKILWKKYWNRWDSVQNETITNFNTKQNNQIPSLTQKT